jgi:hypothetical protein
MAWRVRSLVSVCFHRSDRKRLLRALLLWLAGVLAFG